MVILFAQKMFRNHNSSLLRQHTVNVSFVVFYPVQNGLLSCHVNRTFNLTYCWQITEIQSVKPHLFLYAYTHVRTSGESLENPVALLWVEVRQPD